VLMGGRLLSDSSQVFDASCQINENECSVAKMHGCTTKEKKTSVLVSCKIQQKSESTCLFFKQKDQVYVVSLLSGRMHVPVTENLSNRHSQLARACGQHCACGQVMSGDFKVSNCVCNVWYFLCPDPP